MSTELGRNDPGCGALALGSGLSEACAVRALLQALEARDLYTAGHSDRVANYATTIGRRLGLSRSELSELALGAGLHDIGKIGIPDEVLSRDGPLTEREFGIIKTHPETGERILAPLFGGRSTVLAIVRSHHERTDGTGYPDGLRGEQIPLAARIVAVADAYDAMTTARAYRPALSVDRAISELARVAGTQLDPTCVRALLACLTHRAARRRRPTRMTIHHGTRTNGRLRAQRQGLWQLMIWGSPSGTIGATVSGRGIAVPP